MTPAQEVIARTFPRCTASQLRQYRAFYANGTTRVFWAEDSVAAVEEAQRDGDLTALDEREPRSWWTK